MPPSDPGRDTPEAQGYYKDNGNPGTLGCGQGSYPNQGDRDSLVEKCV